MLDVQDLHAYYGRSHVVQGITLRIAAGEGVGLVGRNGAGKTTTLKSIMGTVRQTRGRILFQEHDVRGAPVHTRARAGIGYVPDEQAVFPQMTVEENVRTGAFVQTAAEQRRCLERAYELFPVLAERRHQPAGTLSGGQQKMLALARGVALQPRLLLVDEPSEGLMPINVDLIARALELAIRDGMSVLVVDASFELLKTVCTRLYVMERGLLGGDRPLADFSSPEALVSAYIGEAAQPA